MISIINRKKIVYFMMVVFLLLWAGISTGLMFLQKKEILILKIHDGKISEISEIPQSDEARLQKSFLMSFVGSYYTYDLETIDNNMTIAKTFFSESGWKKVEDSIEQIKTAIQTTNLSQAAMILVATPVKDSLDFNLEIKFYNVVTTKTSMSTKKVRLHLSKKPRERITRLNPYPWEVEDVEEI